MTSIHISPDMIDLALKLLAAFATLSGLLSGFILWMAKRWVDRIEGASEHAAKELSNLRTQLALSKERYDLLLATHSELREMIASNTKSIGCLEASSSRLWTILQVKGLIEERPSDRVIGKQG